MLPAFDHESKLSTVSTTKQPYEAFATRRRGWQCVFGLVAAVILYNLLAFTVILNSQFSGKTDIISQNFVLTSETRESAHWEDWSANASGCHFFENVCHSAFRWFYKPENTTHRSRRQRTVVELSNAYFRSGYRSEIVIDHLPDDSTFVSLQCKESTIPNHLILYSAFNDMLGEFYGRGLLNLWSTMSWMFQQGTDNHDKEVYMNSFLRSQQLYLHLDDPSRGLMDSHHLFTSLFRSNPLIDLKQLLQESSCHCLPRLALCGYSVQENKPQANWKNNQTLFLQPNDIPRPDSVNITYPFRNVLREQLIVSNAFVEQDIYDYRKSVLARFVDNDKIAGDWKIVGLTQRSSRRTWVNFETVMSQMQKSLLKHHIVVLRINVEDKGWNAYNQLVRHAALDAIIGIHGAQLTEAIWMKPGSLVVELLPYVPDNDWGTWVRNTKTPTPLGDIFTNTDLQHIGIPLTVKSVPYCFFTNVTGCWLTEYKTRWDSRDFLVDPKTVINAVQKMMVLPAKETMTCKDYLRESNHEMVLYNINCQQIKDGESRVHHFYWDNQSNE